MSYLTSVLADAPRHYWRLADAGGGLAIDIGAVPRHLVNNAGTAQFAFAGPNSDGGSGWYEANGVSWDLDVEACPVVCALECWVWQHYRRGVLQEVVAFATAGGLTVAQLRINAAGTVSFFGAGAAVGVTVLATQTWHHLVGVQTALATILYVDGAQDALVASVGAGAVNALKTIGASSNGVGPQNAASAQIAEVAFYPAVLAAGRVAVHFAAADQPNFVPYYKGNGAFEISTGVTTPNSAQLAEILASVRKGF